ncbi:unnamed protein product, partial [Hapterophycus canaliculatus]
LVEGEGEWGVLRCACHPCVIIRFPVRHNKVRSDCPGVMPPQCYVVILRFDLGEKERLIDGMVFFAARSTVFVNFIFYVCERMPGQGVGGTGGGRAYVRSFGQEKGSLRVPEVQSRVGMQQTINSFDNM